VFKWALRHVFYIDETGDQLDVFVEAAENGYIKILELADEKEIFWYNRETLVGDAARTNLDVLFFILTKKPTKFNLSFTRMCVREGFIEVMDWWKQTELVELFIKAAYSGHSRMLDNLYENEYQEACSDLKEFLKGSIVNLAASGWQIDALEWAWDRGMHGGAELCMFAACEARSLACVAMALRG
jgi:hypothetical protein